MNTKTLRYWIALLKIGAISPEDFAFVMEVINTSSPNYIHLLAFANSNKRMVFSIHRSWIYIFVVIGGAVLGRLIGLQLVQKIERAKIKKQKKLAQKRMKAARNLRGGDIDKCIKPEEVYEVVDPNLKKIIYALFGNSKISEKLLFIDFPVLALSFHVRKMLPTILRLGLSSVYVALPPDLIPPLIVGGTVFSLMVTSTVLPVFLLPATVVQKLTYMFLLTIGGNLGYLGTSSVLNKIDCQSILMQQPSITINGQKLRYLNQHQLTPGTIMIKGHNDTPVYQYKFNEKATVEVPAPKKFTKMEQCEMLSEFSLIKCSKTPNDSTALVPHHKKIIKNNRQTNVKNRRKFMMNRKKPSSPRLIPLDKRTATLKTLNDVKNSDTTANLEAIQPTVDRFSKKVKKYENRLKNEKN